MGPLGKMASGALLIQYDTRTHTHTHCRPSEIVELCLHNVVPPAARAPALDRRWALILAPFDLVVTTKTGTHDDSILVAEATPRRSFVSDLLARRVRALQAAKAPESAALFPGLTLVAYEQQVRLASRAVGLEQFNITPHMARHGGPSADVFEGTRALAEVQKRGRWASARSVARYEKHARLLRMFHRAPSHVLAAARSACASLERASSR